MRLRFDAGLPHQLAAIESVCDLFRGQEACRGEFTVTRSSGAQQDLVGSELGIGNRLQLLDTDLLKNLREVQLRNSLKPTEALDRDKLNFTVEMETGTGKTYVYLRTMFELNRRYGFTKFIVVVPSIAIKEGVDTTVRLTREHFAALYANAPFESFVYDSAKLGQVRNFATSPHVQLMIVTVGAINKKEVNNIYTPREAVGGEKPIDLIRETRPIVFIDEPQSVLGGLEEGAGGRAIREMRPLCTLGYSATPKIPFDLVYRLDAVDAYEKKLVKQIEVASATVAGATNTPYVKFIGLKWKKKAPLAQIEVSVDGKSGVANTVITVEAANTDLRERTGRAIYEGWRVENFEQVGDEQRLWLSNHPEPLKPGDSIGGVDHAQLDRLMLRETIKHHLDRELRLRPQGIKVLSLFFIDKVSDYRVYDAEGHAQKGPLATIFEEEYARAAKQAKYLTLFKEVDLTHAPPAVHDGYFAIDKEKRSVDLGEGEKNKADRDNAGRAYDLILRNKEKLLDLATPLKFIFSHSALREGWDNPNVFQICALREIQSQLRRRQTIGRGLRLAVNQHGERLQGFDVNTLTVVANESYEDFAANLQKELEEETGIRFGFVEEHAFANVPAGDAKTALGFDRSKELVGWLREQKLVEKNGKVTDELRRKLKDKAFKLPAAFAADESAITNRLLRLAGKLDVKDAKKPQDIELKRAVLDSEEFKALWARIKGKTTYRVAFDAAKLREECTRAVRQLNDVEVLRLTVDTALVHLTEGGVEAEHKSTAAPTQVTEAEVELPDLLTELESRTRLTRESLVRVLVESGRLEQFARNPQQFITEAARAINKAKQLAIVDGIKYVRELDAWAQELFDTDELTGYLQNTLAVGKSVHSHVRFDSTIEEDFARKLDANVDVKVFAKLPSWFVIKTPLGNYNPDWAVVVNRDGRERLYFVVETKGTDLLDELRRSEAAKVQCGKAHFDALSEGGEKVDYVVADSYEKFASRIATSDE